MDASSHCQNRRSSRSPVMLSAKIELAGELQSVILRNLSGSGALIEGKALPAQGTAVTFVRNDLRIHAHVAWVQGHYAGIAFNAPLERAELLRHMPKPRQKFEAKFRRPGLACRPLSDSDRQMIQMWATPALSRER